jgi:hypothetical protein
LFQIANFSFRFAEYGTFLKENKVITGTTDARRVEAVGTKIKLAEKYLFFTEGIFEWLSMGINYRE